MAIRSMLCAILFFGFVAGARPASAAVPSASSAVGIWTTPDRKTRIDLRKCGKSLCGKVAWIQHSLKKDGTKPRDVKNPDSGLRSRKIVGMKLTGGFTRSKTQKGLWEKGWIYDPQSGKTYSCTITMESPGRLELHGYLGLSVFGASQVWTRIGNSPKNGP